MAETTNIFYFCNNINYSILFDPEPPDDSVCILRYATSPVKSRKLFLIVPVYANFMQPFAHFYPVTDQS